MTPVEPIVPGMDLKVTVIAKDQVPYRPLPIYRNGDYALSRWSLTWRERLAVLWQGYVYLWVMTDWRKPFPPVKIQVEDPVK